MGTKDSIHRPSGRQRLLTINNTHPTQAKFIPTLNAVKRRQKTPK
uniref:Nicotinamide phosphoribosyltransferase n=1 Tax=Mus musculus TaxID=10090 RepID=A0A1W2P8A9_MOUSE